MFVRIRQPNDRAVLYDAVKVFFDGEADEREENVHLTIETADRKHRRVVDKTKEEVYLMNDQGETIEAYRWAPLKEEG